MGGDAESERKSNEDFDGKEWKKKTHAEITDQQYWERVVEWSKLPMLKCPYCNKFKSVYSGSIEHHIRNAHKISRRTDDVVGER